MIVSNTRERLSSLRQKIGRLISERNVLEKQLLVSGQLIEGSFIQQYRTCGKAGCRCEKGERHGPYPYLVVGRGKDRRLIYVAAKERAKVRSRARGAVEFRQRLARINRLNSDIRMSLKELKELLAGD